MVCILPERNTNVMTQHDLKKINLLMVEDNEADVFLTREILSESERATYQISVVKDGFEALSYLQSCNGFKIAPQPDLILLDLNLTRMHGFDFLVRIKAVPELHAIPICIFTTSETKEDREKAKKLRAYCYLIKPMNLQEFEESFAGIF